MNNNKQQTKGNKMRKISNDWSTNCNGNLAQVLLPTWWLQSTKTYNYALQMVVWNKIKTIFNLV